MEEELGQHGHCVGRVSRHFWLFTNGDDAPKVLVERAFVEKPQPSMKWTSDGAEWIESKMLFNADGGKDVVAYLAWEKRPCNSFALYLLAHHEEECTQD